MKTLKFEESGNSYTYDLSMNCIVLAHSGGCEKLEKSNKGKITYWVYNGNKWEKEKTPNTMHINKIKTFWKTI